MFAKVLWIAEMFLERIFYHAHTLDFRSRCYHVTNYLNGQGVDFAKALHLFGTGKAITEEVTNLMYKDFQQRLAAQGKTMTQV